ncbi:alpha-keto acid decarboxylase family protein [Endozoicomonas sp. SCSIO W0465]|uniref:alpha-keto acid decarboxylase family protein n=1 Tax=Endozoicomonas sp. SCSIO W0465 TaxID=2918516 RepID=UPI002075E7D5|nr:thiamine pyrophosphate-binding protein [Endozoicomonas sp. SCSIO W0465]USE36355.1 thiamine pyrophosphate-dependent enzyme [Endozoicomonas sp. SCSIO W0465]
MSNEMTVIQYVLGQIKELGVTDVFGVPGDFVYPVNDAVMDDGQLRWIGCTNELNASYAADGYARTRGASALVVTYGAGELCTFGGLAGAHAENSKVVVLTGMPGLDEQDGVTRYHHMVGDPKPRYDLFVDMIRPMTAGENSAVVMTPENCVYETKRLLAALRYYSKPVYMAFPRDVANLPVVFPKNESDIPLTNVKSDPATLEKVVAEIHARLANAKQSVVIPGYTIRRYNSVDAAIAFINKSGLPFAVTNQERGVISMQHPNYIGGYDGRWTGWADPAVTTYVEQCDCIVAMANEMHDFNNGMNTLFFDRSDLIKINPHSTTVGDQVYKNVEMKDVLTALTAKISSKLVDKCPDLGPSSVAIGSSPSGQAGDVIDYEPFYERLQQFIKEGDIFVSDTAMCSMNFSARARLPDNVELESQLSWGAIGWGTPAILGNCIAEPNKRCWILCGEGGHQMTATELGTYERYGAKPIFILVNNDGYLAERVTNRYYDEKYNDVPAWHFADVPIAQGCKWYTKRVTTLGELDAALAEASKAKTGVYLEVVISQDKVPLGCEFLYTACGKLFGQDGRTWGTRKGKPGNK